MLNIVSEAAPTNPLQALGPALLLAISATTAAATAAATRVFRRGSIVGPDRLEPPDPLEPLAIAMGAGLMVYSYGSLFLMHRFAPGRTDDSLSAADVIIDLVARTAAVVILALTLLLWYRRPSRLGFSAAALPRGAAAGLLSLLMVMPLMMLVLLATEMALRASGQYVHPYLQLLGESHDRRGRALILLSILIAAPVSEELFFRGCLQTLLVGLFSRAKSWPAARSRWLAVLVTSLLFAAAHGDWWSRPPIFILSLCLGYAYERTGNLWTAITIHASFNAAQTLLFINS